ncbi:hypothetical protein B0H65DRAFT_571115 [Neurospora tetraspora]|uniref:Uncharacterized protein n=1 Tax=Neurospora tetraspora TaxID=94610 RepID=A0AAE0JHX6_9PEZI|nr:hypothetical protein B0H65DRAFT_571115 [Neurospora tetraspora]
MFSGDDSFTWAGSTSTVVGVGVGVSKEKESDRMTVSAEMDQHSTLCTAPVDHRSDISRRKTKKHMKYWFGCGWKRLGVEVTVLDFIFFTPSGICNCCNGTGPKSGGLLIEIGFFCLPGIYQAKRSADLHLLRARFSSQRDVPSSEPHVHQADNIRKHLDISTDINASSTSPGISLGFKLPNPWPDTAACIPSNISTTAIFPSTGLTKSPTSFEAPSPRQEKPR